MRPGLLAAWINTRPRKLVRQLRFSISFPAFKISHAHGWRIESATVGKLCVVIIGSISIPHRQTVIAAPLCKVGFAFRLLPLFTLRPGRPACVPARFIFRTHPLKRAARCARIRLVLAFWAANHKQVRKKHSPAILRASLASRSQRCAAVMSASNSASALTGGNSAFPFSGVPPPPAAAFFVRLAWWPALSIIFAARAGYGRLWVAPLLLCLDKLTNWQGNIPASYPPAPPPAPPPASAIRAAPSPGGGCPCTNIQEESVSC